MVLWERELLCKMTVRFRDTWGLELLAFRVREPEYVYDLGS